MDLTSAARRPTHMDHGVYSTTQLKSNGATDAQIRRAVAAGDLLRLRPGWYARPTADPMVAAAVRAGGVLGCVSALRHHGIWVASSPGELHVRRSKALRGATPHRCRGSGPPPPAATAVDSPLLALGYALNCLSDEYWIASADSAMQSGVIHRADIAGEVDRRGRALLEKCDERSQSGTESLVRVRLRARGFTVVVQPDIDGVGRVDLRVGKLLIECDSKAHHTSLANYRTDRRRDRCALVRRWMKMRLTYDDVLYGWDDAETDVYAITRPRRHRIRD